MDKKKLQVLRDVNYTFHPTCGMCKAGQFKIIGLWGTCAGQTYKHEKHTGEARQLSIHILGSCDNFQPKESKVERLGSFKEFSPQ